MWNCEQAAPHAFNALGTAGKLLDMLSGSGGAGAPLIPLEAALAVCEEHNLVAEQVQPGGWVAKRVWTSGCVPEARPGGRAGKAQ